MNHRLPGLALRAALVVLVALPVLPLTLAERVCAAICAVWAPAGLAVWVGAMLVPFQLSAFNGDPWSGTAALAGAAVAWWHPRRTDAWDTAHGALSALAALHLTHMMAGSLDLRTSMGLSLTSMLLAWPVVEYRHRWPDPPAVLPPWRGSEADRGLTWEARRLYLTCASRAPLSLRRSLHGLADRVAELARASIDLQREITLIQADGRITAATRAWADRLTAQREAVTTTRDDIMHVLRESRAALAVASFGGRAAQVDNLRQALDRVEGLARTAEARLAATDQVEAFVQERARS